MFSSWKSKVSYVSVQNDEYDEEMKVDSSSCSRAKSVMIETSPLSLFLVILLFTSSIVSSWILFFNNVKQSSNQEITVAQAPTIQSLGFCQDAPTRREWRTLSVPEQHDYVRAVRCLATKPSKLGNEGTLYDDFPWVHKHTSSKTHVAAPFLPWHRYYIHLYEKALKEECSFHGSLPYWDWSQDYSSFRSAPVWSSSNGLGGDGAGAASVGDGQCVSTGPFSDIEVSYYDGELKRHCLSRGFASDEALNELGELIKPEVIDKLMDEESYETFASEIEKRAHRFLSHSVRGDLSRFTGPNDPVFFLHHTNLDRLWYEWQQRRPSSTGLSAYAGRACNNTDTEAQVTDILDMGGLSRNVMVIDVMDTQGGEFCYRY